VDGADWNPYWKNSQLTIWQRIRLWSDRRKLKKLQQTIDLEEYVEFFQRLGEEARNEADGH
jgi:hypothetical protein